MKPIIDITLSPQERLSGHQTEGFVCSQRQLRPLDIELLSQSDSYLLLYCKMGSISGYLNSVYVELAPSTLLYIAPTDRFLCFDDGEKAITCSVVLFTEEFISGRATLALERLSHISVGHMLLLPREGAIIEDNFTIFPRQMAEGGDMVEDIVAAHLTIMLCNSARFFSREESSAQFSKPKRLCLRFCHLLHECDASERKLDYYCQRLEVSPNHLSYVCGQVLGYSAGRYIDEAIALRARALLLFSHLPVAEISRQLGFVNQSFFGKFFKRRFMVSPLNYRQQYIIKDKKR